MGLELVELTIATESAFGLAIPDAVARELTTPRQVIDYLATRLPLVEMVGCRTQRAFYRVREVMARRFDRLPKTLAPDTLIAAVRSARAPGSHCRQLGAVLGADSWPKFREATWLGRHCGWGRSTLGDVARCLALWNPPAVKGPNGGWTRREIGDVFVELLVTKTGIDMTRHTRDSRFVQDMGLG